MKKILVITLLLSQISLMAQDYKFGKVSKEELEEKFYPLDSTANAAYLYKYRKTFYSYVSFNGGFQLITHVHERIKIYAKKGFDMATKSIVYYTPERGSKEIISDVKGYTYNLEKGKIVKEKLSKKSVFKEKHNKFRSIKKITMPNVNVGSVIEITYKLISNYEDYIDDVDFQFGIPVKKLKVHVEIPEFYTFTKRSKGYYLAPMETSTKSSNAGTTAYKTDVFIFNAEDVPALKDDEPYVGDISSYRGGVNFELTSTNFATVGGKYRNYTTSWDAISKGIYKSKKFGLELEENKYYKNDLDEILKTAKTEFEKLGAIFDFVKSKIKWNNFYGIYSNSVKNAYENRLGNVADINLIVTSMLRSAGLNANPVLVSTRGNGVPLFPTLKGFNYVISMVEFSDGGYVLLDATEPYSLPNVLPTRVLNWNGRKVTKEGVSSWIELKNSKHSLIENNIIIKLSDDLIVNGLSRTKYYDTSALNFRRRNNHIKEDNIITDFEENNNVEVENFKIANSKNLSKPVLRSVKFNSEDLIESINGKLYLEPLLFLSESVNPFKLKERKFPVDFATPWKVKNRVSIQIPEGYKLEVIPEALNISLPNNLGFFKFEVKQIGNKLSTLSILQFDSAIIPAQYYSFLKDFYGKKVKKESEKIVLVKM